MIKNKKVIEIENHVGKFKIRGWESAKGMRYMDSTLIYKGIADGKKFHVETNGREKLADVVNKIVKAVTE